MSSHDVVVIGAGLAGLRCASQLALAGRDVVVLEASDAVGGRLRTDRVDGFLLDRGFQVLNPAYPAVARWVDVQALRLQGFPVGVRVRRELGTVELAHPVRHPAHIPVTLRSGLLTVRDAVAVVRWALPAILRPRAAIAGSDGTLRDGWDHIGLRGPLRSEVLEPFLAGVLAEERGDTSDAFVRLLVRMFALGRPGVPERGIGALPAQLAHVAHAAGADIRPENRVTGVRSGASRVEIDVQGADPLSARAVVVAVGPDVVADLVDVPRPPTRGLQTWWFGADAAPTASAMVHVDGRRRGPIVNTVVMSHTAPSYAPPGRHLIEATCLLPTSPGAAGAADERTVRAQLGDIWRADAQSWDLLRRDDIHDALPAQSPPLRTKRAARLRNGVFLAGDHRDTASIQGALVSGDRVARAVLSELDGSR